ncbi:MAG: HAD hydrolase-like protein [Clostridiales bacterium]|nr:HAD hydrolase-like protein [Clostridiales bacterium]
MCADNCVWIGDSDVDIKSAHNLGCKSIGVTWGFRDLDNINSECPDAVAESTEDILKIFDLYIDN